MYIAVWDLGGGVVGSTGSFSIIIISREMMKLSS